MLARHAAVGDTLADGRLIQIGGGRIDQAVAGGDGVDHAALAFGRVGDLEDAVAGDGHGDAVVEGDVFHGGAPSLIDRSYSTA